MGQHSVTADDALWSAAAAKARAEGTTADAVVTAALRAYTGAVTVHGITVVPDRRMPPGTAALVSAGAAPVPFTLPPAGQPWSRPGARPRDDIRAVHDDWGV